MTTVALAALGQFALALALLLALLQGSLPFAGAARGHAGWMALAPRAALGQALCVALAFALLVAAFVGNDVALRYVAANSNSRLPLHFRVTAVWGGHEGSVLLWALMLSLWGAAVALVSRSLPAATRARVLATLGLVGAGFLGFLLFTSNPFALGLPAPADGRDLNPLLQDWGMASHPPLLYAGYVGFSVAFAFAVAALLEGRMDADWARRARPWTLAAWALLTLGIVLGSTWAYSELGWGGWWFWDAVENASFMPWLVGTALIHSLAVTEKRGAFRGWTVLLAILAFSLSLLGTFLVRSGVLSSVHAFASDPRRGLYILIFLAAVSGGALALYAWRARTLASTARFALCSRDALLLANNLLLAVAAGTVLLGTLYPLAMDALGLGKISVGPPYFEAVFVPLAVPLLLLTAAGPLASWKQAEPGELLARLRGAALAAVAAAALGLALLQGSWGVALGLALAAGLLVATAAEAAKRLRAPAGPPLSWWGMVAAHAGLAVFVLGVTVVKGFETSADQVMRVGDSAALGAHRFYFAAIERGEGPNYSALRARFEVSRGGSPVAVLHPERRYYPVQQMPMTEAAIARNAWRDLYVTLGEAGPQGGWIVRVQHKPLMPWVWGGALLMAAGGALAAADRRRRVRAATSTATSASASASSSLTVSPATVS